MQSPSRRTVLASVAGVAASLAGCNGPSGRSTRSSSATPVDATRTDAASTTTPGSGSTSSVSESASNSASVSGSSSTAGQGTAAVRTRVITRERTTTVPVSAVDDLRLTAATGHALELYALELAAEPVEGANDGLHSFTVGVTAADADGGGDPDEMIEVLFGSSTAIHPLLYEVGTWREANNATRPADPSSHARAVRGLVVDDSTGLVVRYANRTNSEQTAPREVRLWGVERRVTDG